METHGDTTSPETTDGFSHGLQSSHERDLRRILETIGIDFPRVMEQIPELGNHERDLQWMGEKINFDFPKMMEYISYETNKSVDWNTITQYWNTKTQ